MIRVNLLRPRMSAVPEAPGAKKPRKRTLFISGPEAALGVLLLVGGATAMFFYFDGSVGGEEAQPDSSAVVGDSDEFSADAADVVEQAEATPEAADATSTDSPAAEGAPATAGDSAASEPVASASPKEPAGVAKRSPPSPRATPPTAAPAPARAPASSASSPLQLNNLKIAKRQGGLKMTVAMSGRPSYEKFQLDNPNRIVIDIANARVRLQRSNLVQDVDHPLVRRIRVGQFKQDPWVARLVLDVTNFPNLLLFPHSGGLDIQVSKSGQ